jgi:hypothetical protein
MTTTRNYRGKDVEMLTVCAVIIDNAIANEDFLVSKRSNWVPPFFKNLQKRIDKAFSNFLGIDNASVLRKATQAITKIQAQALTDLAELKIQIEEDFKADKTHRDEILKDLGFTAHHKQAQAKDQEALVELLYRYKNGLTEDLQDELTEKGIDQVFLLRIIDYANQLNVANVTQETLKGNRKIFTEEAVKEFNAIYDDVISIAKIAYNFFKEKPNIQAGFSYSKVLSSLNFTSNKKEEDKPKEEEDKQ